MIRRNESIGKKKWMAFLTAFAITLSVSVYTVTAESGEKSTIRAGMISNMLDLIKNSNKEAAFAPAPEESAAPAPAPTEEETDDNIYIKVYFHREGVVKEMALDEYIMGVLYGEVPETYHPEALKAQAVAARSYTCLLYTSDAADE